MNRFEQARADFDRAIAMGTSQPTLAYFNRGMANEKLGALTAAYRDYKKAAEPCRWISSLPAPSWRVSRWVSRVAANR